VSSSWWVPVLALHGARQGSPLIREGKRKLTSWLTPSKSTLLPFSQSPHSQQPVFLDKAYQPGGSGLAAFYSGPLIPRKSPLLAIPPTKSASWAKAPPSQLCHHSPIICVLLT
jgi:hypothetical protein